MNGSIGGGAGMPHDRDGAAFAGGPVGAQCATDCPADLQWGLTLRRAGQSAARAPTYGEVGEADSESESEPFQWLLARGRYTPPPWLVSLK